MASPITEQTYSPPYKESALRAALRSLAENAQFAFQGLGSVRPGSNFVDAFLQSSSGASRAAQEYAMKQMEAQRLQENSALDRQYKEALIEQLKKPPKPEKPEKIEPHNLPPDEYQRYLKYLEDVERAKARGKPPKVAGKPGYKPPKVPPRPGDAYSLQTGMKYNAQDEADIAEVLKAPVSDFDRLREASLNPQTPPRVRAAMNRRLSELKAMLK